ncbi:TIR domain-containing protein [Saccharopolyspora shandongensis]|uniref:TIR domain-containing protein n=1 Tax=Saccharopolyspora shandongensis TaxID=418495 RepID=A0A1H3M8C4_9PSEU|nr:toll/interleukin-1 receptor domain-containing protein [Saccharopolyspora shandongensis]SDY72265.1 TIR domain-containing protein [Saccharopolyspora shandongensis]
MSVSSSGSSASRTEKWIFISYRREDTKYPAGGLNDLLGQRFGPDRVFYDLTTGPGVRYVEAIDDALRTTKVLLALIGERWIDIANEHGHRRLDDPRDLVAHEIATALDRGLLVIPVLVDGARLPGRDELPERLRPLVSRNATRLAHESFSADADKLIGAIVAHAPEADWWPVPDPVEPASSPGEGASARRRGMSAGLYLGLMIIALVLTSLIAVLSWPTGEESGPPKAASPKAASPVVDHVWQAGCGRRYLDQPVAQADPAALATAPKDDDAVLADDVWLDISVRNTAPTELLLDDIQIEEVGRDSAPQTGFLVRPASGGCAQGTARFELNADLDSDPPTLSPPETAGDSADRIALPFPIGRTNPETFRLRFSSRGCECRFRVVLRWRQGGVETEPVALPADGKRFHVVPRGDLPAYRLEQTGGTALLQPE